MLIFPSRLFPKKDESGLLLSFRATTQKTGWGRWLVVEKEIGRHTQRPLTTQTTPLLQKLPSQSKNRSKGGQGSEGDDWQGHDVGEGLVSEGDVSDEVSGDEEEEVATTLCLLKTELMRRNVVYPACTLTRGYIMMQVSCVCLTAEGCRVLKTSTNSSSRRGLRTICTSREH
eukprot:g55394.t1